MKARTFAAGDIVGCGVVFFGAEGGQHRVFWTLNGESTGLETSVTAAGALYACVSLKHGAQVILNTGQSNFRCATQRIRAAGYVDTGGTSQWMVLGGSSMGAPQVSGMIALLGQAFPNHTPEQLTDRLLAYNLGMVYFMGLGWGMNQVKSTINSIKDLFNKND